MNKITAGRVVRTSIVSAFTLAAAFIWRDVIMESIEIFFPSDQLLFKFIAAIMATAFVIVAIFVVLRAEDETKIVLKKFKGEKK